jgi:molybdopterin-guanine dinucleotide biosynthesis protein A
MGQDKAWLPYRGHSLLARQVALARRLSPAEIFISGRAEVDYSALGCPVLTDDFANTGPLAGIESALTASATPLLLVLAVDMPHLTVRLIHHLAAQCSSLLGVVPRVAGCIEPLAAFYPTSARHIALELLGEGQYSAKTFVDYCVLGHMAIIHDLPAATAKIFANWNSPDDLTTSVRRSASVRNLPSAHVIPGSHHHA